MATCHCLLPTALWLCLLNSKTKDLMFAIWAFLRHQVLQNNCKTEINYLLEGRLYKGAQWDMPSSPLCQEALPSSAVVNVQWLGYLQMHSE